MADLVPENTVTVMMLTTLGTVVGSVEGVAGGVGALSIHALVVGVKPGAVKPQVDMTGAV